MQAQSRNLNSTEVHNLDNAQFFNDEAYKSPNSIRETTQNDNQPVQENDGESNSNEKVDEEDYFNNDENTLNLDEELEISGLTTEPTLTVEEKYRIKLNNETKTEIPLEEKPFTRTVFIAGLTGLLLFTLLLFWQLLQGEKTVTVREIEEQPKTERAETEVDYRAKLALRDQKLELEPTPPVQTIKPEPTPSPSPTKIATPPPPIPQPPAQIANTPTIKPPTPPKSAPLPPKTSVQIDPERRWRELSSFGESITVVAKTTPQQDEHEERNLETTNQLQSNRPRLGNSTLTSTNNEKPQNQSNALSTHNLTLASTTTVAPTNDEPISDGAWGILNHQSSVQKTSTSYQLAFGTSFRGIVSSPLHWDNSIDATEQIAPRFAISLTEDLLDGNDSLVLKKGTVVIAEAHSVNPDNQLVQASAIGIVYQDKHRKVRQQPIEPGMILIQGTDNQPLIAKTFFPEGGSTTTDLFISSLSGLGRIGQVFTEPKKSSTVTSSLSGSNNTSITVDNSDREVWAAVLDGFFNPLADRLTERAEARAEKLAERPNISMLPANTRVSLLVNGFINIER